MLQTLRRVARRADGWDWLLLGVSLLGLVLRVEHALTFDQVHRASDYTGHLPGVRWTQEHWRPFFHDESVNYGVRSYPPLWYFLSALLLELHDNERLLVVLSLFGWSLRHTVLWLMVREVMPRQRLAALCTLGIHAVLPLSVLIDGKVNPEGFHAGVFALALYVLWRLERQLQLDLSSSLSTAALFGVVAGLALLAKITGALLIFAAAAVFAAQAIHRQSRDGWRAALRRVAPHAFAAAGSWLVVAGWWCGTNLARFHHPFPHVWDLETAQTTPILADPALYRRPLGWVLPFEWRDYWHFPMLRTLGDPRPNFWATEITGTWSDVYNRGFCRLGGGETTDVAWGAAHGFLPMGSDAWLVTLRCVDWMATMLHVGVWITIASVISVGWCLWRNLHSRGAEGSLALPVVTMLCTASGMWFALAHPYDNIAALNPRYLLSQVTPMSACLGFGLARLESRGELRDGKGLLARAALVTVALLIAVIGAMLVYERFGW